MVSSGGRNDITDDGNTSNRAVSIADVILGIANDTAPSSALPLPISYFVFIHRFSAYSRLTAFSLVVKKTTTTFVTIL